MLLLTIIVWLEVIFGMHMFVLNDHIQHQRRDTYRAAVYEHSLTKPEFPAKSKAQAIEQMMVNLRDYEKHAAIANAQGVDILVFPEDGIYGYTMHEREEIQIYLESLPDPTLVTWIPCDEPDRFNGTYVQEFLSCLAKNNTLYIVANFGDAQPCISADPNCPSNGQYQYNTDVVYDKTGTFIAKYHKQNLFFETQFNEPINPEYVYFDTDFGRFGMFTCFDILFHEPAIPLLEYYNITDVVFPTAWMDAFPFFTAIGYHSSFAVANRVNLLAANLHDPIFNFQGSGIYTPNGANKYYYNTAPGIGQMLISDVDVNSKPGKISSVEDGDKPFEEFDMKYLQYSQFKSTVFHDWYDFVSLTTLNGNITVCQKGFCCFLSYDKEPSDELYALGVFNAIHVQDGPYYLQNCLLLRCKSADKLSCGNFTYEPKTQFYSFTMKGNVTSHYINPQIMLTENGTIALPTKGSWSYRQYEMRAEALNKPLLLAALVSRIYVRD